MKNQRGYTTIETIMVISMVAILTVGGIGWVKNIIKLSNCDFSPPYKAEVIHAVGIISPVGAVTGWPDVGK